MLIGECAASPDLAAAAAKARDKHGQPVATAGARPLVSLLISATVVFFSAIQTTGPWETTLVMVLACLVAAIILTLLVFGAQLAAKGAWIPTGLVVILVVLWAVEVGIGTFRAPFNITSNGYFASWVGFVALALIARPFIPASLAIRAERVKGTIFDKQDGEQSGDENEHAKVHGSDEGDTLTPHSGRLDASPSSKAVASEAEQRIWPLLTALGEQQAKASAMQADRDAARAELQAVRAGSPGGGCLCGPQTSSPHFGASPGGYGVEYSPYGVGSGSSGGGSGRDVSGGGDAAARRLAEIEATLSAVQSERDEALAALEDAEEVPTLIYLICTR